MEIDIVNHTFDGHKYHGFMYIDGVFLADTICNIESTSRPYRVRIKYIREFHRSYPFIHLDRDEIIFSSVYGDKYITVGEEFDGIIKNSKEYINALMYRVNVNNKNSYLNIRYK